MNEYGKELSTQDGLGHDHGRAAPARSRYAHWLIAFFLGVIAACLLLRTDSPLGSLALAQPSSLAGARGVFAFTGQLSKERYGLFMVDVDQGTIWCYELNDRKHLNLVAGRSWRYDRYLEEFNVGEPKPDEVEKMVEDARNRRLQGAGSRSLSPPPSPTAPAKQQTAPQSNPDGAPEDS